MLFLLCDLALRTYAYFIKKKEGKLYQFSLLFYLFPTFFMSLLFLRCVVHNHSYHNSSHRTHSDKAVFPEAGGSSCRHYELGGVGYFIGQVIEEPVV